MAKISTRSRATNQTVAFFFGGGGGGGEIRGLPCSPGNVSDVIQAGPTLPANVCESHAGLHAAGTAGDSEERRSTSRRKIALAFISVPKQPLLDESR